MKVKTFKTKLWLYFALFSAIIFSVLWLSQTVFLQSFYNRMLMDSTKKAAQTIIQSAGAGDLSDTVDRIARERSLLIYITDQDGNVICVSDEYNSLHGKNRNGASGDAGQESDDDAETARDNGQGKGKGAKLHSGGYRNLPEDYGDFLARLKACKNGVIEYTQNSLYVYGAYLDGGDTDDARVLYVSATLNAVGSAITILRIVLAAVTVFSLLVGFALAWFIAKKFARPVAELSEKAKRLDGDERTEYKKGFCAELDALNDTLDETGEKLRRSKSFRQELLANISHDLRTPLTMIRGYAESISDMGDDEELRKSDAAVIIRETDRLSAMVNEILEYSELQADGKTDAPAPVELGALVNTVADTFEALLKREGAVIEREIGKDIYILGSAGRLERAVYNLIDNAVRHTDESKRIRVELHESDGRAKLRVTDFGEGIPPEQTALIWDRYYTTRQRGEKGGSGLGLAIVKQIAKLYGGECGVESEPGKGSVFELSFPLL